MRIGFLFYCFTLKLALLAPATAALAASSETPLSGSSSTAPIGAISTPMIGWLSFCRERPEECAPERLEPAVVTLTSTAWSEVITINQMVNKAIKPVADDEHYGIYRMGIRNWWTYPDDGMGNCNDYVLLKRRLLIEAGWPKSALLMTVVRTPEGEGHLVLMARTNRGDLVLDNMRNSILAWDQTGYEFIKRQAEHDPNVWLSFLRDRSPGATTSGGVVQPRLNSR